MGFNLTGNEIRNTYPRLVTISGSIISNGTGSDISNLTVTSSYALTASVALNVPVTASYALSASQAVSASYAISASTVFTTQTNANQNHFVAFVAATNDYEGLETDNQLLYNPNTNLLTVTASLANNATSASSAVSSSFAATASFLIGTIATASFALNAADAELLDGNDGTYYRNANNINAGTLPTARLSGGYSINVTGSLLGSASYAENAGAAGSSTSASFATNASLLGGESGAFYRNAGNLNAGTVSSARLAGTYTIDIAGNAATATTASLATSLASGTNINVNSITASNGLFTNLTATSASFGYITVTTGSAVIIGEQYIILNADSPAARYAGIQVYDSGSGLTGSFEWDSVGDDWIQVNTSGQSAGFLTGLSGSKGSEVYPANNTLLKGTGNHTVQNSIITDNGSTVTVAGTVSASVFVGNLNGNAATATSASFATTASFAQSASVATNNGLVNGTAPSSLKNADYLVTTPAVSSGTSSIALGNNARNYADFSVVIGDGAQNYDSNRTHSVFIGTNAGGAQNSVGIGKNAAALSDSSVSIGIGAAVSGDYSVGIGQNASVSVGTGAQGGIAIGRNTATLNADEINIGNRFRFNSGSNGFIQLSGSILNPIVTGSLRTSGSNTTIGGILSVTQSVNDDTNGVLNIYSTRVSQDILRMYEFGQQAYIKAPRLNGYLVLEAGGGANDSILLYNSLDARPGAVAINRPLTVSGSTVISGSVRGEVRTLAVASNTASLDCSNNNFFTLQLTGSSNIFVNPTNIQPGQTINLRLNTTGSGTVSFPSSVKQVSGSSYVPTTTTGVDVVTFISFDTSSLFLSNVKNLV